MALPGSDSGPVYACAPERREHRWCERMAMSELQVVRTLLPLLSRPRWALPAIVTLGVAASLAEGVGLAMFVPLLQTFAAEDDQAGGGSGLLVAQFDRLLGSLEGDRRLLVLTVGIFLAVSVRALLSYANDAVFGS